MKVKQILSFIFIVSTIFFSCSKEKESSKEGHSITPLKKDINITRFEPQKDSLQKPTPKKEIAIDEFTKEIGLVISNWDNIVSRDNLTDEESDYWLEVGVRQRYKLLSKYIGKSALENIIEEEAFIDGPHSNDIDFNSQTEFGYYNPTFLIKLHQRLKKLLANETFVQNTQSLYDHQFKKYLQVYYLSYETAINNPEVIAGYLEKISASKTLSLNNSELNIYDSPSYYLFSSFHDFSDSLSSQGYNIFESISCPGFWVRRSIDGTASQFYTLLELILNTYDPEFIGSETNSIQKQVSNQEFTEDEYLLKEFSKKIDFTRFHWDDIVSASNLTDTDNEYWLDVGVRVRYKLLSKYIGKAVLEDLLEEDAFLEGLHSNGIDFNNHANFGYYNPKFLVKLHQWLDVLLANETFVQNAQALYDQQLKKYLQLYYLSYELAVNNKEVKHGYIQKTSTYKSLPSNSNVDFYDTPSYYIQNYFSDFATSMQKKGYNGHEAYSCPGFWVRRSIDETSDEFYDLLILVLKKFDPEFIRP